MTSISGLHFLLLTPNPRLCLRQNVRSAPIFGPGIQLMAFTRWHEGRLQHTWTRRSRGALHIVAAVKKSSAKNVACSKTLVADAGKEAAVDALCQKMVAYTRERQADRTAGIMTFEYSKDAAEPNVFHLWEVYESNVHMGRHNTAAEMQESMKQLLPLLEGPVGMALYEMKDGKLGAVAVQGGPKGEGGLDDATGASGAAGGASYKQTSATVDLTAIKEDEDEDRGLWGIKIDLPLPWFGKNKKKE